MISAGGNPNVIDTLIKGTPLQGGAFIVGPVLGQGGFGITYQCGDRQLHRYVAIKELFPQGCRRVGTKVQPDDDVFAPEWQKLRQKFLEEARALARFHHPGIVQVLTIFEENNTAYMVMEFLRGQTLRQLLDQRRVLSEGECLNYIEQIVQALTVMHNANVIHCDIKPENLMVCEDGRVVLVDFGLNKKLERSTSYATRRLTTTLQLGTAGYAAPEQYVKNMPIGAFTDNYGLGATLYHLLTGIEPIPAPERALGAVLLAPAQVNPLISHTLSQSVMRMLELSAPRRPQTAHAFLDLVKRSAAVSSVATNGVVTIPTSTAATIAPAPSNHSQNPLVLSTAAPVTPPAMPESPTVPASVPVASQAGVTSPPFPSTPSRSQVHNILVWWIAVMPVCSVYLKDFLSALFEVKAGYLWLVPLMINVILNLGDEQQLEDAGYDTSGLHAWLVPIYLFQRAALLQQSNLYAIVWLITFVLAFLL
jgi:serine/threonine-protein kinase